MFLETKIRIIFYSLFAFLVACCVVALLWAIISISNRKAERDLRQVELEIDKCHRHLMKALTNSFGETRCVDENGVLYYFVK